MWKSCSICSINNAIYPTWAAESLPKGWQEIHTPTEIQIHFKTPTKAYEQVDIVSAVRGSETIHKIAVANEVKALIVIGWKENLTLS